MSFRRKRDEWAQFVYRHRDDLRKSGIPEYVVANKLRFMVFLDHGFDQFGWRENPNAFFDARILSEDQIARLAELVASSIDERYRVLISSRWQRSA